jgi:predicted dehydrogenase
MREKLKIIQVGAGAWGSSWHQIVSDSPDWISAAIVDVDEGMRRRLQQQYNIPDSQLFLTLSAALQTVAADAVLVVVPPEYHAEVSIEAFEHKLHCLVEKPLAGSMWDAQRIVAASEQAGCKLMVSQNYRFRRAPQTVRRLVKQGCIGPVGSVFINFQKSPKFKGFRVVMEEPLLTDMAIHHFDQIRGLLQLEPVSVRAVSWNPPWSTFKGNATASAVFEMNNGAIVCYTGNWVSQGWQTTWDGEWRIHGNDGEIHWVDNEVFVRLTDVTRTSFMRDAVEQNGLWKANLSELHTEDRWACMTEFASSIRDDRSPETSGQDNLKSLAMVIGARKAAQLRETVELSEILSIDDRTSGW